MVSVALVSRRGRAVKATDLKSVSLWERRFLPSAFKLGNKVFFLVLMLLFHIAFAWRAYGAYLTSAYILTYKSAFSNATTTQFLTFEFLNKIYFGIKDNI